VLIDENVVWEDDVEGDEGGWQHLVIDVSKWVIGREAVELAFRLQADKGVTDPARQITECYCYVDDVCLFGGSIVAGDFESDEGWSLRQEPADSFRIFIRNRWSGEARSGKYAYVLGVGYAQKVQGGAYCEVTQNITIEDATESR